MQFLAMMDFVFGNAVSTLYERLIPVLPKATGGEKSGRYWKTEFGFVEFGFEFIGYGECVDLRGECKRKRFIGFVD